MLPVIPPLAYYLQVLKNLNTIYLYPSAPYPKSLNLNSFSLPSANGYLRLSIPLRGGRTRMRNLADTEIDYREPWLAHHKKTLDSCYKNSPWYDWYVEGFWEIYVRKYRYLLDKTVAIYQYLSNCLGHEQQLIFAYQSSHSPIIYTNQVPEYPQVFMHKLGFMPNVSLLDLLFHLGTEAKTYIKCYSI